MGTLGFRPDAVRSLRFALTRCLGDLGGVRVYDAEAVSSAKRLTELASALAEWPLRLDRVANSSVLTEYDGATGVSPATPVTWSSPYLPGGWYSLDDRLLDPSFGRGWALGNELAAMSEDDLSYDVDLTALRDRIGQVVDDPTARRALFASLSQSGVDDLFVLFHAARDANAPSQFAPDGPERFALLAETLVVLGRGIADQYREDGSIDPATSMQPLSSTEAAWLLSGMDLDPQHFAGLAYNLIESSGPTWTWPPGTEDQPRPGDILLPVIADRPDTSRSFVDLCLDGSFDVLFDHSNDTASPGTIVLHAADPTVLGAAEAGRSVTQLLEYLLAGGIDKIKGWPGPDLTFLGEIVVRYPLEILANGPWAFWGDKTAIAALAMIVGVDSSREWIQANGDRIFHNLWEVLGAPIDLEDGASAAQISTRLNEVGQVLSQLGAFETAFLQMVKDDAIADAEAQRAIWELFGGITVDIAGALLLGPAFAGAGAFGEAALGAGASSAGSSLVSQVLDLLAEHGIGANPAKVAASESEKLEVTIAIQAGMMVNAVYQFLIRNGLLDPAAPPPPAPPTDGDRNDCLPKQYGLSLTRWADDLDNLLTGRARGLVDTAIAMTGQAPATLLCTV